MTECVQKGVWEVVYIVSLGYFRLCHDVSLGRSDFCSNDLFSSKRTSTRTDELLYLYTLIRYLDHSKGFPYQILFCTRGGVFLVVVGRKEEKTR